MLSLSSQDKCRNMLSITIQQRDTFLVDNLLIIFESNFKIHSFYPFVDLILREIWNKYKLKHNLYYKQIKVYKKNGSTNGTDFIVNSVIRLLWVKTLINIEEEGQEQI